MGKEWIAADVRHRLKKYLIPFHAVVFEGKVRPNSYHLWFGDCAQGKITTDDPAGRTDSVIPGTVDCFNAGFFYGLVENRSI